MKLDGTNVIEMSQQSKEASAQLVVPNFDLVIVSSADNERLVQVKIHSTDRTVVLFKAINHCAYTIVPTITREKR
jgi:hypothetical protein